MTKAALIRTYIANFPEMGPSALARRIVDENNGLKVRPNEVGTIKGRMKREGDVKPAMKTITQVHVKGTNPSVVEVVLMFRALADSVGGKEEAKRILDAIG
jgi:hypothetical protein